MLGSLGVPEILLLLLVVLLLFGTRIPSVMRSMGQGISEFKKGLKDSESGGETDGAKTDSAAELPEAGSGS